MDAADGAAPATPAPAAVANGTPELADRAGPTAAATASPQAAGGAAAFQFSATHTPNGTVAATTASPARHSSTPASHAHTRHSSSAHGTPAHSSRSAADHHASNGHREHSSHSTPHRDRDRDRDRDRERERRSRRTLGDYALGKTLGAGSMGKVKLAVRMGDGEKVAIKIIPRNTSVLQAQNTAKATAAAHNAAVAAGEAPPEPPIGPDGRPVIPGHIPSAELARLAAKDAAKEVRTIREGSLQLLLHHPYVCGMREMMIHTHHYYMVFEYVNGGQMLDYIISHGRLRERSARKFARQIGSALEYCHRNSIVHRDLKIENILISGSGNIKIIDFGLSNLFSPHSHLSTFCGSLYFAAPELLQAKVYTGPEVDVWSFGIVLYVLVNGKVPFDDQSMPALHAKIKRGQVEYPAWLSPECKHLLSRMLNTNPAQRATLPEVLSHPWMIKGFDNTPDPHIPQRQPIRPDTLDPEVIKGMTGFEFGTAEDIQTRMLEILTSDTYLNVLRAWEARNGGGTNPASPNASSTAIGSATGKDGSGSVVSDSHILNRQNTRSSMESGTSKMKNATKRFSGIDFYRKKIAGNGLFGGGAGGSNGRDGEERNGSSGSGVNGSGGPHGGQWSGPGVKEPLDPTRGYHPLLSIYYLVSEKMERERVYGANFFASSNISVAGPPVPPKPVSPNLGGAASPTTTVGGSMPTAADIPSAQDALRVPEATRVSKRGKDATPGAATVAAPSKQSTGTPSSAHDAAFSTPIFDSRQKSQPLPNMAGPPRARAMGDEVEAALRGSTHHTHSHRHSALPAMASGAAPPPSAASAAAALSWQQSQQQPQAPQGLSTAPASDLGGAHGHGLDAVLPPLPASASASGHKRSLSLNMRTGNPTGGADASGNAAAAGQPGSISASSSAGSGGGMPLLTRPMARLARAGGGSGAENRRSVHIMMTPRSGINAPGGLADQSPQHQQMPTDGAEPVEMVEPASSSPFTFGNTLSRRIGSLIGRSPSTPLDSDTREKRRLARMSTGGMFGLGGGSASSGAGGPISASAYGPNSAGTPGGSTSNGPPSASPNVAFRRGSLHLSAALSGVAESRPDEEALRISEAHDTPPADPDYFDEGSSVAQYNSGGTGMKRAGTAGPSLTPSQSGMETPTKGSSHRRDASGTRASVGRAGGKSLLSSSASASEHSSGRRPFTAGGLLGFGQEQSPSTAVNASPVAPASAGPGPNVFPIPPIGTDGGWQGPLTSTHANANALPTSSRREAVKPGAAMSAKPVFLKGLFSVQTTTTKSRAVIHADLIKVFDRIGLPYREIQGGYECTYLPSLDFSGGSATAEAGKGYVQLEQTIDTSAPGHAYADTSGMATGSGGTETLADLRASSTQGGGGSTVGDDSSSARGPKRRTSRMSFASSKKDRRTADESAAISSGTAAVDSTSSVGAATRPSGAATIVAGDETVGSNTAPSVANAPRSRASSITADFENESAVSAAQAAALAGAVATGGVVVAPSPNASGALATPTGAPPSPSPAGTPNVGPQAQLTALSSPVTPGAAAASAPPTTGGLIGKSVSASVASRLTVQFEIFVVKVPLLLGVNGLQFRRVAGNPWQYQMLAKRVLQELKL
ncbi:Serine/threonine-protein kinase [Tilletia horrida]|nr:Serine/threonine-protein kinase [Tilletia horrida]